MGSDVDPHLAQINVARMRQPPDHLAMAFVRGLDRVNATFSFKRRFAPSSIAA